MKKVFSILALLCSIFLLTACSGKKEQKQTETGSANDAVSLEMTSEEAASIVDSGEEETIIGPGGTVLNVKKAKDSSGKDIYVEEITDNSGKKSYKQVVVKDDGSVTFVDVEPNDKGEYVTKSGNSSGTGANNENSETKDAGKNNEESRDADSDWVEGTDDYNNASNWSDMY